MYKIAVFLIIAAVSFTTALALDNDTIYSQAFGNPADPAIIFLHNGPGGNSFLFRAGCAEALSQKGFYVVTYDRRGCGHSSQVQALYKFDQVLDGIDSLYSKYNLTKSILIGEDFGGMLALLYAKRSPDKVSGIVLISVPLKFEDIYNNIIDQSEKMYTEQGSPNLDLVKQLEGLDPSSFEYARQANMHAQTNDMLSTPNPDEQTILIYQLVSRDPDIDMMQKTNVEPLQGFIGNENFAEIDLKPIISEVKQQVKIAALYGADDKTFSESYLQNMKSIMGNNNFYIFPRSGHQCYIDAREKFMTVVGAMK